MEKLFLSTTGLKEVPDFTSAEVDYLKLKLLETAALKSNDNLYGTGDLAQATQRLIRTAEGMNLLKVKAAPAPHRWPIG